jgi:hypothetical protein
LRQNNKRIDQINSQFWQKEKESDALSADVFRNGIFQDSARLTLSRNLCAVVSGVLVLDLLESSDGLSLDLASSVASPSAGGGAQGGVDLRVQLAEVVLGEDGDLVTFFDDRGVALVSGKLAVRLDDLILPEVELSNVASVLFVLHIKGLGESLKNLIKKIKI